ncbi:site-specific DNA-methyltransferase [Nostocoides vanveenii]|uniref:Methyltransferase n=1 Tax=Nostocoides vanveenii TaxID=330835 RepID=A0ABP4X6W9_9MICO
MTDRTSTPRGQILVGDALATLRTLPTGSVDQVLTSPPYFRLRDYDARGQLGLEGHVDQWVSELVDVAVEVKRVLVSTGTFWLNVSDTYSTHAREGSPRKSLLLGPERLALALVSDGWRLRNKIVWQKANPMPHSVTDRLTCTWEALFVFTKQDRYFFDLDAIRVPHLSKAGPARSGRPVRTKREQWRGPNTDDATGLVRLKHLGRVGHSLGKNPGDVLRIPSSNYRGSHHATFPVALAELAIRAGCPEARCLVCRLPYRRGIFQTAAGSREVSGRGDLRPTCECGTAAEPGLVLDPFMGAGTTALGAIENRRDWAGIELSPHFAAEAEQRIAEYAPNGAKVATTRGGAS